VPWNHLRELRLPRLGQAGERLPRILGVANEERLEDAVLTAHAACMRCEKPALRLAVQDRPGPKPGCGSRDGGTEGHGEGQFAPTLVHAQQEPARKLEPRVLVVGLTRETLRSPQLWQAGSSWDRPRSCSSDVRASPAAASDVGCRGGTAAAMPEADREHGKPPDQCPVTLAPWPPVASYQQRQRRGTPLAGRPAGASFITASRLCCAAAESHDAEPTSPRHLATSGFRQKPR